LSKLHTSSSECSVVEQWLLVIHCLKVQDLDGQTCNDIMFCFTYLVYLCLQSTVYRHGGVYTRMCVFNKDQVNKQIQTVC